MTKTSAAKRFAEANAIYSHVDDSYTLLGIYQARNTSDTVSRSTYENTRALLNETYAEQERLLKQHTSDLKIVMALLGVEDQYEDTVTQEYTGYGCYEPRVTKSAVRKFAEDLRAAQSAIDGRAALKRLRKAIKSVTKEEYK